MPNAPEKIRVPAALAPLIGREIEMYVRQMPGAFGMTIVDTVPVNPDDPLLRDIRKTLSDSGRVPRIIFPNKIERENHNPNIIDIYVVRHEDGKYRTSLGRSGLENAPKIPPQMVMTAEDAVQIPTEISQGMARPTAAMKAVRFRSKPPGGTAT